MSRRFFVGLLASTASALSILGTSSSVTGAAGPPRTDHAGSSRGTDQAVGPTAATARTLVARAVQAARASRSVHYVESASAGTYSISVVGDVSPQAGRQVIVVRDGRSVGHVTGVRSSGKIYYEGDANGLESYLGMPAPLASRYASRWIGFSRSDPAFAQSERQFTISGPLSEIDLSGTLSQPTTAMVDDVLVMVVRGRTTALSSNDRTGSASLAIADDGSGLPVRFMGTGEQAGGRSVGQVDFSGWGETVLIAPPAGAVPASKVR